MTKAAQIRELAKTETKIIVIADAVRCSDAYVRVVLRQRVNGRISDHDRRYRQSSKGKLTKEIQTVARRAKFQALYETVDMDRVRKISRNAYRDARAKGMTRKQANSASRDARKVALPKLGNKSIGDAAATKARIAARRQRETLAHVGREHV